MMLMKMKDLLMVDKVHDDNDKFHCHKDDVCEVNSMKEHYSLEQQHCSISLLNSMLMNMNRSIFLYNDDELKRHH